MSEGSQVAALQRLVARLRRRIEFIEGSRFWRLRGLWHGLARRVGMRPDETAPPIPPREFAEAMDALEPYTRWLFENEPRPADLARLRSAAKLLDRRPSIAVVIDDAAGDATLAVAAASAQAYDRCRLVRTSECSHAAELSQRFNAALEATSDDVIVFCNPHELLAPNAAFEAALAFLNAPNTIAVYGDRDVIEALGRRRSPQFLADWSPDTFLGRMYTGPTTFYRSDAVRTVGGFRDGLGAALHYDLALRIFEGSGEILHRPSVLVHELNGAENDPQADADLRRVAAEALVRRGEPGAVQAAGTPGVHVVRYAIRRPGRVEVIVPTRDLPALLERCVDSVFERNHGSEFRITIIDNGSAEAATHEILARYREREGDRFAVIRIDSPFNFSRLVNAGVRATDGPYLLLLNNDAEFVVDGGLLAMVEQAQRPSIGAVGARLLYSDGRLQHAGVVIGLGGYAGHVHRGADGNSVEVAYGTRNVSAVTAAAMMVRRDAYEAVGGFDEELAIEFNDIDFCLKLRRAAFLNVCLSHVVLRHEESSSRGVPSTSSDRNQRARERELFRTRWQSDNYDDPYYNRNLTRGAEDGTIAF